jgi:hypothetical protein
MTPPPATTDLTPGQSAYAAWQAATARPSPAWDQLPPGEQQAWDAAGHAGAAAAAATTTRIEIPGRDWDMRDWPAEDVTVGGVVTAVEGGNSDDDRVTVTHSSGRRLKLAGCRAMPDGTVDIVIDEAPDLQAAPVMIPGAT